MSTVDKINKLITTEAANMIGGKKAYLNITTDFITIKHTCDLYKCTKPILYKLKKDLGLNFYRLGRKVYLKQSEFEQFFKAF